MSSNRAETPPSSEQTLPSRRSWSLTIWLTLVNTGAAFCILSLSAFLLYWGLAAQLENQNRTYFLDELGVLKTIIRDEGNGATLADEASPDHSGQEYVKHYFRLLDKGGGTIIASPDMEETIPSAVFPAPVLLESPHAVKSWHAPGGASFLLTSLFVSIGGSGSQQGVLQLAMDVSNVDSILVGYRYVIAAVLVVGFLCSAGVSLAVARKGTRPLREITAKARQITAANLEERLDGTGWPVELNVMAGALNGMLDRLHNSFSRLYNSVANLTHKLRTPITILKGEAEVALAGNRTVEELREVIESSLEECGRLSHLVDNIIFVSRADVGKLHPVLTDIDAHAEIEKIREFYEPLAEEKGIVVTCQGNAILMADRVLFCKAVANLLSNAITYTPAGGTVLVSASDEDDGFAKVVVTDTGCGIAEEDMPKIFDRFYRVYATRFMDPRGSGLGLPITKAIMKLHNGSIEVTSRLTKGTTVTLRFPTHAK